MEQYVDGEKWVVRGWTRVLNVLYETDVTIELSHVRVPDEVSDQEYMVVESLSPDSDLLTETELTEDQAIRELNHLLEENLVHHLRPFEDQSFAVYRLTEKGFKVAHDLRRTEKEDEWRKQDKQINAVLTVATGFLAATAVVQAILSFQNQQPPTNYALGGIYLLVVVITVLLIIGGRGSPGPEIWK